MQKCIEWKVSDRLTPEAAFAHPFIAKAVNELKCREPQEEQEPTQGKSVTAQGPSNGAQ